MRKWMVLALTLGLFGCGDDSSVVPFDAGATPDSGPDITDTGIATDTGPALDDAGTEPDTNNGLTCAFNGPYGSTVGSVMAPIPLASADNPFQLETCDGEGFAFPDQATCDAKLTILSIAAGWCGPCIIESRNFERVINDAYDPADVRLIQLIIQKEDRSPPDLTYCRNWVERYGLSNTELIDPAQLTQVFFPDNALPQTVIIDNTGLIVARESGVSGEDLSSLTQRLDGLLAAM